MKEAVSVAALADAIVEHVNVSLPSGYWATRETSEGWGGVWLCLNNYEGKVSGSGMGNLEHIIERDDVTTVVMFALDAFQDDVAEATTSPWPRDPETDPLPRPWATLEGDRLALGYGSVTIARDISLGELSA
jgi:hypothetical protein